MVSLSTGRNENQSILIVEDEESIRDVLREVLELEGYPVTTAKNGKEALELLSKNRDTRLILLDLMMPVMSGWEFLQERKTRPELQKIPVIILSAVENLVHRDEYQAHINKPFDIVQVLSTISDYLKD